MRYPHDNEIVDPATKLPPAVAAALAPYVEDARRRYSRFRQRFREDIGIWAEESTIVVEHADDVFKKLVALALRNLGTDFKAFRHAIGWEGGAAETAFWYAHYLYKDVTRGRMPREWQWKKLEPRLSELIDEAEDLWRAPDVVPKAWASVLGGRTAPSPAVRPPDVPVWPVEDAETLRESRARSRMAFVAPILDQKGWSQLDLADHATLDHKTIGNFLGGAGVYRSTRLKLAQALGIPVEQLPQ